MRLNSGNTDWTLAGNSFFQTASRAAVSANVRAIYLNSGAGNNFTVTGNFIGGSAPGAGGTAWTTTTNNLASYRFVGIQLSVGNITPSSVQGNTVQNIAWTSFVAGTLLPGVWCGIYVQSGAANLGAVTGNTIGSGTGTGSVSVTSSGSGSTTFGIGSASSDTVAIANNTIGSITANGTAGGISASLVGIQVTAGVNTISGNTVGSATTANSLNAANFGVPAGSTQQVTGILSSSGISASITGNMVANLNNSYTAAGTAGQIRGIVTSAGANTITGNTVRNLSTTSANPGTAATASVLGISQSSTVAGQTVSKNVVHSLANTAASPSVTVTGIYFAGPTSGTNVIARNLVHSLAVSSTSATSAVHGMYFDSGTFTGRNNMVRVGIDAGGTSTAGASGVAGIYDAGTTAGRNFYHNSVAVGGTQTSSANNTSAFTSSGVVNARAFQNNILVNARGNSGGTGQHYAVNYGGTTVNPAGLTTGGNIFHVSGTGGVIGFYNSADRTTLAAWQAATGQDATSAVADPLFVNATGDATAVDLHLQAANPAEGSGLAIAAVTDDFDGQTRGTLTPADIGADAGNFTLSSDGFAPVISYPLLTGGSTANRVLTGWATIADNSGTVSGGASVPRLYYKKQTDADAFAGNTAADNGWKFVPASNGTSPYGFTIDYSLLNGGGVSPGGVIQYFVVAQDAADNLGSSPAGATAPANPPVQYVNAHAGVNSYTIISTLSGTKTVGSGGDYPSLGGPGGLFAAINGSVVTGNLVVNITSDLTEDGSNGLSQLVTDDYPGAFTVTIQPSDATMKTISGSLNGGLVTLNGADRVTMDGRFGGAGRYLTFRNTSTGTSASTILFINDASNNTVRSCLVEGATKSTLVGVIGFSTGTLTGNDNNLITDNQVRDLSTAAGVPAILIGSTGSSNAVANSNNTISNNELFNFYRIGVCINATGNNSWTVSGNNIYEATTQSGSFVYGIQISAGGTNVITGNSIHDLLTTGTEINGIFFTYFSTTTISKNRITCFNVNAATTVVRGIGAFGDIGSTLHVVNNQITLSPAAPVSSILIGLHDGGFTNNFVNVFYNTIVLGGTESGANNSWASRRSHATIQTARNNIFFNLRTGGTGSHFAAGSDASGGSYTANHNVYAGTGATPASFMDFSTIETAVAPVTFAAWQASTGGDANSSAGSAGTGNFTAAMFVNAATGDLHLIPGGNPLVNNTGTAVSGITDDYDGDARSATAPFIGADELVLPDIAIAQSGALTDGAGSVGFDTVTVGSSSAALTFTITNPGTADLTSLAITGGTGEFSVSALSGTSVPVGSGSVSFTVTFTPAATGPRSATLQIASNVTGAKNPFDIALTGTGQTLFQAWAAANGVPTDNANLLLFAFGMTPGGGGGALQYAGTLAGGGTITATGLPVTWVESIANGADFRALFVRRVDSVAAGLTYTPQFSADMSTWQNSAAVPVVLAADGVNQIVSVPYPVFIAGKKARFFRISVTLAP